MASSRFVKVVCHSHDDSTVTEMMFGLTTAGHLPVMNIARAFGIRVVQEWRGESEMPVVIPFDPVSGDARFPVSPAADQVHVTGPPDDGGGGGGGGGASTGFALSWDIGKGYKGNVRISSNRICCCGAPDRSSFGRLRAATTHPSSLPAVGAVLGLAVASMLGSHAYKCSGGGCEYEVGVSVVALLACLSLAIFRFVEARGQTAGWPQGRVELTSKALLGIFGLLTPFHFVGMIATQANMFQYRYNEWWEAGEPWDCSYDYQRRECTVQVRAPDRMCANVGPEWCEQTASGRNDSWDARSSWHGAFPIILITYMWLLLLLLGHTTRTLWGRWQEVQRRRWVAVPQQQQEQLSPGRGVGEASEVDGQA